MITTQLNPAWLDPAAYLEFLNSGFPGQWDRASLEFYTGRSFLGRSADLGVRADGRRILAGVSYCHRQIRHAADEPIDVCVLSAGTTLESERGRGHYRGLLETGIELCRARSYAAILGFVTRDNGSGRGLERLGAYSIPSFYIVSNARRPGPRRRRRLRGQPRLPGRPPFLEPTILVQQPVPALETGIVRFHYPSRHEWLQQFVSRPNPVRALRIAHDATAILESVGSTDRLQYLSCPRDKAIGSLATLAAASSSAQRSFFTYTLDPLLARAAARLGLAIRAGFLMLLPVDRTRADWAALAAADWRLHSGDRL